LTRGWLLDLYSDGDDLVLWIKQRSGGAECFRVRYPPSFYVSASQDKMELLRSNLEEGELSVDAEYACKRVDIGDHEKRRVLRIQVGSRDSRDVVSRLPLLEKRGYRFFNVDVPRTQGFLYEHDLFPMGLTSVRSPSSNGIQSVEDRFSMGYEIPPLKQMGVTVHPGTSVDAAIERIVLEMDGDQLELDGGTEDERIVDMVDAVNDVDPDVVYVSGNDLSHISKRAQERGVAHELVLGRDRGRWLSTKGKGKSYFSYGTVYYKEPHQPFFGRVRIDPKNSFMYEDSGLEGLIELARLTKIPIQKGSTTSPGTGISSMQLDQAYREDLLIPWRKQEPEAFKSAMHLLECDRGGFILEPRVGFHTHIGEIDFASMYPSIMERHNISPETVLCNCCRGTDAPRVPTCGYHLCTRRKGIVPKVLRPLLERRAHYKRLAKSGRDDAAQYDMRQRAIKWLLVCCFGYLGYRNARFGRVEAHEAVTAFGRDKLFKAIQVAEESGYEVLHGIVDSLWLKRPGMMEADYEDLCSKIQELSELSIGLEGIYRWIVFLPSKMYPEVPVLNRYFGVFESGEIKVRGIELRRSDTPGVVKNAQLEMLKVLSQSRDRDGYLGRLEECVSVIHRYANAIRGGDVKLEDLVISRRASKAPWEYTNLSHIAVSSLKLHKAGKTIRPGQFVGYVITKAASPNPWERVEPIEFHEEGSRYDEDKYIDEVIKAGTTLFEGLGYGEDFMRSMVLDGRRQSTLPRPTRGRPAGPE
jgi:DNA polymerase elongation subunit (family B)